MRLLLRTLAIVSCACMCVLGSQQGHAADSEPGFDISADLVSRYVWRGLDYTNAPCLQPSIEYSNSGFFIGAWGATTLSNSAQATDEIDVYTGYKFSLGDAGTLGVIVTDYYFPNLGVGRGFGDFSDGSGAHVIEAGLQFDGEELPFWLHGFVNFWNDSDNSVYVEAGYNVEVSETELSLFIGGTLGGDTGFYGTPDAALINIGVKGEKTIAITDSFSLPVYCSMIGNPNEDILRMVFGMTLTGE